MPPDDSPFEQQPEQGGQQSNGSGQSSEGQPPAQGVSREELNSALGELQQSLGPMVAQAVAQALPKPQESSQETTQLPDDDPLQAFVSDPEKWARDHFGKMIDERLTAHLGPVQRFTQERTMEQLRQSVVDDFGDKAWDEKVGPQLEKILAASREAGAPLENNPAALQAAVSAIVGNPDNRKEFMKMAQEIQESRRNTPDPPNLPTGPGAQARSNPDALTPEMKELLARRAAAMGGKVDEASYVRAKKAQTIEDWAASESKGKK